MAVSVAVKVLSGILIFLVVLFLFSVFRLISLILTTLNDFISYIDTAFLNIFTTIENGIIEFWDILYDDAVELINEIENEFNVF